MGLVGRNRALLCGTALAIFANVGMVQAQEDASTEQVTAESQKKGRVTQLQRLVLGAGQEKVAIDTPQAVSVLEQEDIDSAQPSTVADVIRKIPGVNVTGSDRVLGQSFNIRGVGAPENSGDQGRIIVNVDGVQKFYEQYRLGSFFSDPELFKRVEVLRGPASSTLYGSGALGGVVNFTTKDASDFIAEGDRGALKLKSTLESNGKGVLGSATLAQRMGENAEFLLMGNWRQADVYESGNGSEIIGTNFRAWSGLAKGTFKVGDEGTLRLSYQRWDSDLDDQQLSQTSTATFFGLVDRHVVDQTAIASYENPFSDNDMLDLKVALSYSDTSNKQRDADLRDYCGSTSSFNVLCDSDYAYKTLQFNAQNTMEWRGANWENFLTYGAQIAHQSRVASIYDNSGDPIDLSFHPEGTDLKAGFFVQNEFIWNDRLTLIPGVRFDWHELTPEDAISGSDSFTDTAISPKLAAHYKFNDTIAVFGSIAHTERFPTIDEVFSTSGSSATFLPSLDLKKELSTNYEAGFALSGYDMLQTGDSGQLKFTGFYNDITDLIAFNRFLVPGPNNIQGYENISSAEIYGFEIETAYDSDYVFANAAYTYTVGRDLSSNRTEEYLTSVAPHELKLTLGGKLPQHDLRFGWNARFVAGPLNSARDYEVPPPGSTVTRYSSAFDVHDIFLSWTPKEGAARGWEVQAGIDNVFNRPYKEFLMNDPAKGRTFKLSLSKQIGW
ncbi:TonB-dependent hemoglobin/transferrin/lactoferrin family receptor [Mesorhizobium australicum]|uniref:Hemoglobin/transferrin/lactoferrin receptor protein n=1 Tax=Mesorhizobium australicum TaxID=536018 RepID=A0A1X7P8C1_9HYPH|nr:TonB-dependent hemoglobin/transferrin/lactoferrin family receptor [Mesorhizobium australicum]SMH47105.1 hemoglobin/transferrin/lactoferrin receptor protein [Mesorhizobium australicum]